MNELTSILQAWISDANHIIIWLSITSVLLFGVSIPQYKQAPWLRSIVLSFGKTITFLCIIVFSSLLINSNFTVFDQINGSFDKEGSSSNQAWKEWRKIYGGRFTQANLDVKAYKQVEQTVSVESSSKPLYMNVLVDEIVQQNNIEQFNGEVTITTNQRGKDSDTFNTFLLTATYEYEIVNLSTDALRYEFRFPLSFETTQYQNIFVHLDEKEIPWNTDGMAIFWEKTIYPEQRLNLKIQYDSLGELSYLFRASDLYEIKNFDLTVNIDTNSFYPITTPENSSIRFSDNKTEYGDKLHWQTNNAIGALEIGFDLKQGWPYSPYHAMLITLPRTANACIYFLVIATLIMIIYKSEVKLSTIGLLAVSFLLPSFLLMSGGIPHPASITADKFATYQVMTLPLLSMASVFLVWYILQKLPDRVKNQILFFLLFFAGVYPIIGLLDEQKVKNAETILQAAMIAYFFIITLINHLKGKKA